MQPPLPPPPPGGSDAELKAAWLEQKRRESAEALKRRKELETSVDSPGRRPPAPADEDAQALEKKLWLEKKKKEKEESLQV